jgi:hypothetical protein
MGWNNDNTRQSIIIDDLTFSLCGIAEKSGFKIFICEPSSGNKMPDKSVRKKIESKVTKLFQEHLIIFIDEYRQEQVWQLAVRKAGSPTKISETHFMLLQDPELLYQRTSGLFFTLDEEEKVTIIDVTKRVADNFQQNNEQITKKFYDGFKKEHTAFLNFIKGIDDQLADQDNPQKKWYASLMLNRLMFCYFIQKKGFLDNNKNYLRDKLNACKEKKGKNQFYSFYRNFLLTLFHKGLGAPEHNFELEVEIGKIPYLNGGLFDEHEIEKTFNNITIDDKAFEKLFDFFGKWEWHLDTSKRSSGKDINPDVMGYIFEKYINDQAQMGAYYTKEDITDYISKNCIIPWLFDEVKRNYPKAFAADGWLWQMVKGSGTEYIYDAVKYGVPENGGLFDDLPDEIQQGFVPELENKVVDGNAPWLWELRKSWNKPAPSDIALPTEIYREVIERRKRYAEIKTKIESGEIKEINDFITYNLNIRQFAQDVVKTTGDAEFIRHFYKALSGITVLDPTCGSGAFLFAAMNILEPLYGTCILRMKSFVDESGKGKHKLFEKTLAQANAPEHPNLQYFIYKSIILNNLYGVDIMNEAVEIAKLRLFLKLVATVDADYRKPNLGLEPLPDVDFNIRTGNTLVGYANEADLDKILTGTVEGHLAKPKVLEKCDMVARVFAHYKNIQLKGNSDFEDFKHAKDDLNNRLETLRNELSKLLHEQYSSNLKYDRWLATHKPFHWFAEFYEIVAGRGGFSVVIGNPPYVEYGTKLRQQYSIMNYQSLSCGNLHAFCAERCLELVMSFGRIGLIVPLPTITTSRMEPLQKLIKPIYETQGRSVWVSAYDERPSGLFSGVDQRLMIELFSETHRTPVVYSTGIRRWPSANRDLLFPSLLYCIQSYSVAKLSNGILKINSRIIESRMTTKLYKNKPLEHCRSDSITKNKFYYRTAGGRYWKVLSTKPFDTEALSEKVAYLRDISGEQAVALISSSTFWWYYSVHFDMFNLKDYMIFGFRFSETTQNIFIQLDDQGKALVSSLKANSIMKTVDSKTRGAVEQRQYIVSKSKPIIDQIDCLLAQHYGFTHEELDFIINYDIKYRMGKELENGEDNNV